MYVTYIERSPGVWRIRIELDRGPDGQRRFKFETIRGTRDDVDTRKFEILKGREQNTWTEPSRVLVATYLSHWVDTREAAKEVTRSTIEAYRRAFQNHIIPTIGGVHLQKLTTQQIEAAYTAMTKAGLEPATVLQAHAALYKALGEATRATPPLLVANPAKHAKKPKAPRAKRQGRANAISQDDLERLQAEIAGTEYEEATLFTLETGMRRGEMCGLQWRDIDLDNRLVTVSHQMVQYEDYTTERKEPKTEDGARSVSLSRGMTEILTQRRERAMATAIENGWRRDFTTSYVFPYKPKVMSAWFHRVCKKLGLKSSFHSLRHTNVTRLLDAGADIKYVSERVGHSDTAFTRDRYQSTNKAGHDKVADLAESLFERGATRSKVVKFR